MVAVPDQRKQALQRWACETLEEVWGVAMNDANLQAVSGDASFRRYFRLQIPAQVLQKAQLAGLSASYILVDAAPEHEDCQRFVLVADVLRRAGVYAPIVHEVDYLAGFMLLQDFGNALYLPALLQAQREQDPARADTLYGQAIATLLQLQEHTDGSQFAPYDRKLLHTELMLFEHWYCRQLLGVELSAAEQTLLDRTFAWLEAAALSQPVVCVHRDYHSRNLMIRDADEASAPGVIDFQDAVHGPYTYDLVSLLRDCYIVWPQQQLSAWQMSYLHEARRRGILAASVSDKQFLRDFDLMGLQRHIKVIGIFCRLYLRDGKPGYLQDIPRVIDYVFAVAASYPELQEFVQWLRALQPLSNERLHQVQDQLHRASPEQRA
ncbi:MAG: phosphotransferase [Pseudomonadales bacterium]|nr:phosphotransferase [Pseudomonadales bacterium]